MLYPTYATSAPKHNYAVWTSLNMSFPFAYQGIMNVMQLPSTQVPLGLGPEGLPIGCQVIGVHGNDHVTIAVARELEKEFGGWVPPKQWIEERNAHASATASVEAASSAR
jgi:fatty acid amide hydrolase 2